MHSGVTLMLIFTAAKINYDPYSVIKKLLKIQINKLNYSYTSNHYYMMYSYNIKQYFSMFRTPLEFYKLSLANN